MKLEVEVTNQCMCPSWHFMYIEIQINLQLVISPPTFVGRPMTAIAHRLLIALKISAWL